MQESDSLSHVRWDCKHQVLIVPKYRPKALYDKMLRPAGKILRELCRQRGVELVEGNLRADHVDTCLSVPPNQ